MPGTQSNPVNTYVEGGIETVRMNVVYLLCINNKDDDDDGLGMSSSCRKIPKIGYLLYAD